MVTFGSPGQDSKRRLEELKKSRAGMEFPMVSINGNIDKIDFKGNFLHFSFIAGKTGFEAYTDGELAFPHGGPYVKNYTPGNLQLPSKSFIVKFSEDVSVQVVCNIVPGTLNMPFLITGQEANTAPKQIP